MNSWFSANVSAYWAIAKLDYKISSVFNLDKEIPLGTGKCAGAVIAAANPLLPYQYACMS